MNLPNYFLADLPPEATLAPAMIEEACQTLKRNRERYLAGRATPALIRLLSDTADNWLQPDYPFRKLALEAGPKATGFSAPTLASGLDNFFRQLTAENLRALLVQELGHAQRLDDLSATSAEMSARRAATVRGPEFLVHITAGGIPNPAFMSIILGVLLRSAQFVKCARGSTFLPRLFAHSLYDADAKLGACLEIAEWPGGAAHLETPLFHEADCVTATGSDETLEKIRRAVPAKTRLLGYGHRVSFGYIATKPWPGPIRKKLAARAATDVVAWNQLGCLSPHVIYVENGGGATPEQFAEVLAQGTRPPRGGRAARRIAAGIRRRHRLPPRLLRSPRRAFARHPPLGQREFHRLDRHLRGRPALPTELPQPVHLRERRQRPDRGPAKRRRCPRPAFPPSASPRRTTGPPRSPLNSPAGASPASVRSA